MSDSTSYIEEWLNSSVHGIQINDFECVNKYGDNHIQLFLQEQATDLMKRNLVRAKLLLDKNKCIIGFYSLFNDTIKLNKKKREQLNVHLPHNVKEIPSIRLHYIGVDNKYRNKGYGVQLIASVIVSCATVAKYSGCALITLESPENIKKF